MQDYFAANVDATRSGRRAPRRDAGVPLIHISSLAAAGPAPPQRAALGRRSADADQRLRPQQAGRRTRRRGAATGLRWTILRPGVVYGPRDRALLPLFRFAAARAAAAGRPRRMRRTPSSTSPISSARLTRRVDQSGRRRHRVRRPSRAGHDARAPRRRRRRRPARGRGSYGCRWRSPTLAAIAGDRRERSVGKPALINSRRYVELAVGGIRLPRRSPARPTRHRRQDRADRAGWRDAYAWYRKEGWL